MYEYENVATIFDQDPVERKVDRCASDSTPLIIGGTEARQYEFPHMVSIRSE